MELSDMPHWGDKRVFSKFEAYLDLCDKKNKGHPFVISELARVWNWHRNTIYRFIEETKAMEYRNITYKKEDKMSFLEKDLEDMIWNAQLTESGRKELSLRGLHIEGKMYRQVCVAGYGKLDLMSIYIYCKNIFITIYELKKDGIDAKTMMQAARYKHAISEWLYGRFSTNRSFHIRCVLLGQKMDLRSDFPYLYNCNSDFSIYIYTYGILGIFFEEQEHFFSVPDSGIKNAEFPISIGDLKEIISIEEQLPF